MPNKKVVAVIPARMGASRFPGKPLFKILDLPLIEHVRRRVLLSNALDDVVVATCDQEIFDTVTAYGGHAVMTATTHERCTDRVEEASAKIDLDIAVIVQGDEPLFFPDVLDRLIQPILDDDAIQCTNVLSVIHNEADLQEVDIVKAVINEKEDIMFFSRSPIPHKRVRNNCPMYRQTGVSAFTKSFLQTFSKLSPTSLEITESVDFLRILGHGYSIRGILYDQTTVGVDRLGDVEKVETLLKNDPEQNRFYQRILNL
ncbi:3-deoxy-manno-octulosonate cytidylyltransferase [Deltaproteobacteria bacterium TL4]